MKLTNQQITIDVSEQGAELTSIYCNRCEYLWQANPEYWKRHSPVLFPIVGSVWNGQYRLNGKTYSMGQHGFARDMQFQLVSMTEHSVLYALESSEETLEKYPYDFRLEIGYEIKGKTIEVLWRVYNKGNEQMFFQIGAHPAFYWPMLGSIQRDKLTDMEQKLTMTDNRGYFSFGKTSQFELKSTTIEAKGCVNVREHKTFTTDACGRLPLSNEVFNHDALVLENNQVQSVTLHDPDGKPYLTLKFDAPVVGLWSPPHKNAPFVCIEPWYGRCDQVEYADSYEHKDWIQKLGVNDVFSASYQIVIE